MNPITKTICGSVARHWLGAFLAIAGTRIGLTGDASRSVVSQLTDEMAANCAIALGAAVIPAAASIWTRLTLYLRVRLALLMNRGSTEREMKNVIAEAPRGAQLAAVLSANPFKL